MKTNFVFAAIVSGLSVSALAAPKPTAAPAAKAAAKSCDITVEGNDSMQYNTKELKFAGCSEVKLTLKHTGKLPKAAMGHNLVIAAKADMAGLVADAAKAGPTKDYAPAEGKAIAHTKLIGGGESDTITFKTDKFKKGTEYAFFCTFPGHNAVMSGKVSL